MNRSGVIIIVIVLGLLGCSRFGAGAGEAADPMVTASSDVHEETEGPLGTPAPDPNQPVQACGVAGTIDLAFVIPPGQRYDDLVPGLTGATELEGSDGGLVLFYEGTATLVYLTGIPGAPRDPTRENVVCVITPEGDPNVYSDIDRDGVVIPPAFQVMGPMNDVTICEQFEQLPTCSSVESTGGTPAAASPATP